MAITKNSNYWVFAVLIPIIIGMASTAHANLMPSKETLALIKATCPSDPSQQEEFIQLRNQITAAETINQAHTLVLAPTNDA